MRRLVRFLLALSLAAPAFAGVALKYPLPNGPADISWPQNSFPIHFQIDRRVVSTVTQQSVIDRAFDEWAQIAEAKVSFSDDGVADVQAGHDSRNSISVMDDLFKDQGYIAKTSHWWDESGRISESDIQIDPVEAKNYNVQQLVAHEVGHLLGLDHSAVLSSVMFPYVDKGPVTPLDVDERNTIAAIYPKSDQTLSTATMMGRVIGDDGGIFAAHVVALDARGNPVASDLTDEKGDFLLRGLPAGAYRVYAEPLDGPVEMANLSGIYRTATLKDFPTEFLPGPPMQVENGKVYGNLVLNTTGTARLNPIWIGLCGANGIDATLTSTAITMRAGQTATIAVAGDGFISGLTKFDVMSPNVHRVSDYRYAGNYVSATFAVDGNAASGSAVILVSNSDTEQATLTGALRIDGAQRTRVVRK